MEFFEVGLSVSSYRAGSLDHSETTAEECFKTEVLWSVQARLSMPLSKLRKIISLFTLFKQFLATVSWSSAKSNHLKFCLWFVHKRGHTLKRVQKKNIWRMCELIMNLVYFKNIHLVNSWNVVYNGNASRLSQSGTKPPASKPCRPGFPGKERLNHGHRLTAASWFWTSKWCLVHLRICFQVNYSESFFFFLSLEARPHS